MSFMRMFKGKKGGNKENVPALDRKPDNRTFSKDEYQSAFGSDIYTGDKNGVINPYSIVTAPKTTKGSRSLPGGPIHDRRDCVRDTQTVMDNSYGIRPFSDRHSHLNNSVRYENLRAVAPRRFAPEQFENYRKPPESFSRRHDVSTRRHRPQYHENYEESDDDDLEDIRIRTLESKLDNLKRRYHDDTKQLRRDLRGAMDEIDAFKKEHNRQLRSARNLNKALQDSIAAYERLRSEMKRARMHIAELEDRLHGNSQSANASSLLMCSYSAASSGACLQSGGAGEALCSLSDPLTDIGEMVNSSTPSDSMFLEDKGEIDAHDEVRVFRTIEADSGDDGETTDCDLVPQQTPKNFDTVHVRRSPELQIEKARLQRSLSDTDVSNFVNRNDKETDNHFVSTLDRDIRHRRRADTNYLTKCTQESAMTSGSSSEDDNYRMIERQLRKKGEVVKFQPPRTQVQPKHYQKYGKNERTALKEFEYLHDMSSDVSGMLSSPDVMSHPATSKQFNL